MIEYKGVIMNNFKSLIGKNYFFIFSLLLFFLLPQYSLAGETGSNSPIISMVPASVEVTEGNSGTKTVNITISINECPDTKDIKIKYYTANSSAKTSDSDYIAKSGYITFSVGNCTQSHTVSLKIIGDTKFERKERFYLKLLNRSTHRDQSFSFQNYQATIYIKNDDTDERADLEVKKYSNRTSYSIGDIVTYTIYAKNRGPYKSKIKVVDALPAGLSFVSVTDDFSSFSCSESSRTITCTGSKKFTKNQRVKITIKARTTQDGVVIKNTAYISSPNNIADPKSSNNRYTRTIYVGVPGGRNTVDIYKTVNNATPAVDDIVTFTIRVANRGFDKKIAMRDKFPLGTTGTEWGTTRGAFEFVSLTKPADVTCEHRTDHGNPYIFCYSNGVYTHDDSFIVTIDAKVLKRGHICNRVYSYEYYWTNYRSSTICMEATGNIAPTLVGIPDVTTPIGTTFNMTPPISNYANDIDGDPLRYSATGLPPGLSINPITSVITGVTTQLGNFTVHATVTDSPGDSASDDFIIHVILQPILATPNVYDMTPGNVLHGNVILDDTGSGPDTGYGIIVTSNTQPSEGTLTIDAAGNFSYTPIASPATTVTFEYTITDNSGATSTATVTIAIGTDYQSGVHPFELINPPRTRNIVGGYKIAGNTVTCLTEKTTGYGGTCHGQNDYAGITSNMHVNKYIDIDNDTRTWNSSSSYIELPNSYYQRGGKGIAWAGLFWQGRFSNGKKNSTRYPIHYAKENGSTYSLIETSNGSSRPNIDIESTQANLIKLKINTGSYADIAAQTIYNSGDYRGRTYAAFADVTELLQTANLGIGKHTFTVANLGTSEGREGNPGLFGGWSLAIIYLEDPLNGSPRNISIYSGFDVIEKGSANDPIQISGFRLPEEGAVKSQFSLFSGEGEALYSPDTIKISNQRNSGYVDMPGSSNADNVFDAVMDGILRDEVPGQSNNLQTNNNGVDVDDFNVSTIIEGYRDNDPLIQNIYIKYYSNQDYITPSMLAFSTELYQPKICYNYTLDVAGYVLRSTGNEIKVDFGRRLTDPLTTRISVQSQEGDFPLQDVNISYQIADTSHLRYITDSTALAPNGISNYIPAGTTGLNQTYNQAPNGFGMYIGTGANPVPGPGGTIGSFETRYIKFQGDLQRLTVNTFFDLWIEYTVDYGSGPLNLSKQFNGNSLCETNGGYFPAYNIFNIAGDFAETDNTSSHFGTPYNIYTQVVNRPFDLRVFSYDIDYLTPNKVSTDVEIELINADLFSGDTNISCNNPDSNITAPQFVQFRDEDSVALEGFLYDQAIRTTAFRIWYLTAPDGSFVEYNCSTEAADPEACFDTLYSVNYADDNYCNAQCSSSQTGCYACIRHYYGTPVCSRDNFSIRPESFVVALIDSNQSEVSEDINTLTDSRLATGSPTTLVAGYKYRFDVNATDYISEIGVTGYQQTFNDQESDSSTASATLVWADSSKTLVECNEVSDQNISISLWQGTNVPVPGDTDSNATLDKVSQVGLYQFELRDHNWTEADWNIAYTAHHNGDGFNATPDCALDDNSVIFYDENSIPSASSQNGCLISSANHTNPNLGHTYNSLSLQFYPYQFALSFNTSTHPSGDKGFVYINTLDDAKYTNGVDENISFNIQGSFTAQGFDAIRVSNFVGGCYAIDTAMNLHYTYLSDIPSDTSNLTYDLIDYNSTDESIITRTKEQNTVTGSLLRDIKNEFTITQNTGHFAKDMQGSITMDLGFNFDRDNTKALNPRRITFHDLNISMPTIDLSVNLIDDHTAFSTLLIDRNISFFYASVQPAKLFYDDITDTTVVTPISVLIYCDLGFTECQLRGLDTLNGQTSDFNWWKSWNHDNITEDDGKIVIESALTGILSPTPVTISTKGENNSIVISNVGLTLPTTVDINLVTDTTKANFTDRWLIFNPSDPFYRVRFINSATWAGFGDTGHVVGGNSNTKKGKRLEW